MKKLLLATSFSLLLTACGTASVDDLVSDSDLLAKVSQECAKLMVEGKSKTEECKNADLAMKKVASNIMNSAY